MNSFIGAIFMKAFCVFLAVLESFGINVSLLKKQPDKGWNTNYTYVLFHGVIGWGDYNPVFWIVEL